MPMVRAMRLLNAIEIGNITSQQLETYLSTDASRLLDWTILCGMRGQTRRMAATATPLNIIAGSATALNVMVNESNAMKAVTTREASISVMVDNADVMTAVIGSSIAVDALLRSSIAMTAVAASSTAMNIIVADIATMDIIAASSIAMTAVAASSIAMTAVAASSIAMTAVAASSIAMTAVAASSIAMSAIWASNTASDAILTSSAARAAIYDSDIALAELQYNPAQIQRQIDIVGRVTTQSVSVATFAFVPNGIKCILLRRYYSSSDSDYLCWRRGETAENSNTGVLAASGGRSLWTATAARGCVSGTYTNNGVVPLTNDDTANFVSACNGLKRSTWTNGAGINVYFITI